MYKATFVSEETLYSFQVCLLDLFRYMDFFGSMDFANLRLLPKACLNLLRFQDHLTLPRILRAEEFVGFLMDRGWKRLCTRSLSVALGGETLGQMRDWAHKLHHTIIETSTEDLSHITSAIVLEEHGILYDLSYQLNAPLNAIRTLIHRTDTDFNGIKPLSQVFQSWQPLTSEDP